MMQPEALQRYRIDCYLERWDKALQHLSECGPDRFEECLQLIKRRSLYLKALDIFDFHDSEETQGMSEEEKKGRQERSDRVWTLYGQHLIDNAQFEEAGRAFMRGNRLEDALKAFKNTENWRNVMIVAKKLGFDVDQTKKLAFDLSSSLINSGRFADASFVLLDYCDDPSRAVTVLVTGCLWSEAIRIALKHNLDHLISDSIRPAVLEV